MTESIIFAPTLSGRPHIGTACNLAACALVAEERGAHLIRRLDSRDEPQRKITESVRAESVEALDEMAGLLGIQFHSTYTSVERRPRYNEIIERMIDTGHAKRNTDDVVLADTLYGMDMIHGQIREYCSNLTFDGQPYSTAVTVIDAIDFNEAVHIRGNDLLMDMMPEVRLWNVVARRFSLTRQPLRYAHFPLIADATGEPLHKSNGPDAMYDAAHFLKQWITPLRRRSELAQMMIRPDSNIFSFENVRQDYAIHINATGAVVGATPWAEAGMFCE